jgi:hypothetical protein
VGGWVSVWLEWWPDTLLAEFYIPIYFLNFKAVSFQEVNPLIFSMQFLPPHLSYMPNLLQLSSFLYPKRTMINISEKVVLLKLLVSEIRHYVIWYTRAKVLKEPAASKRLRLSTKIQAVTSQWTHTFNTDLWENLKFRLKFLI